MQTSSSCSRYFYDEGPSMHYHGYTRRSNSHSYNHRNTLNHGYLFGPSISNQKGYQPNHNHSPSYKASSQDLYLHPTQRNEEYRPSNQDQVRRQVNIHKVRDLTNESPVIILHVPELKLGQGQFFINTGADVSLIKISALEIIAYIRTSEVSIITGVTLNWIYTISTTKLELFRKIVKFHVVRHTFSIYSD